MRLESADGPDRGSMTVLFTCPTCGRQTAMLTNSMETQVVRSLGVKIGGRSTPAAPMEMIRGSLVGSLYGGLPDDAESSDDPPATSRTTPLEAADPHSPAIDPEHHQDRPSGSDAQSSKCPFTGMVDDAFKRQQDVRWSDGAIRRMERIPEFARAMVMRGVEDAARARGTTEITEAVLDEVRGQMGL